MFFDSCVYSSNLYPGCNIYTRYNTIYGASKKFLHWSLGQEEKNGQEGGEEARGRRRPTKSQWRWRRGLSPHLSSPASGKAYARNSSALFLYVSRGPGGHPLCFSSPSTLEEVGYSILLHSWFLWEAVGLCITLTFLFGLRIPKKVRWSMHLNHFSLPLPLTTTYYLRQNCRSSPPHLYSSVIAQILLDCPDEDLQSASCFATLALKQWTLQRVQD